MAYGGHIRKKSTKELIRTAAPNNPAEEVEELFKATWNIWEASEPCKQFRSILTSTKTPSEINQVIAFACGTMVDAGEEAMPRRAFEHALILTVRDVLSKKKASPDEIICYAQDPSYTESDKSILNAHRITPLDDPKGFLEVDDSTVVVSTAPNVPVRQIVSDLARSAMMIWNTVRDENDDGISR